jgi:putative endonuclease
MSNKNLTTFYVGVTNDLERRVKEHKGGEGSEFTSKYNLTHLVYYEVITEIKTAIQREKQLKNWHRKWKIDLIKELNPEMLDLAKDWG